MHDRKLVFFVSLLNGDQQRMCAWSEYLIIPLLAFCKNINAARPILQLATHTLTFTSRCISHFGPHPKRFLPTTSILEEQNHTSLLYKMELVT